ncbi:MAG: preprotein translocase [Omnitrophica bacterium RIFCSPLOWO2_12_FULL_44_17]|uniref:Sec-independent protein translocase protein TatA n=1 Tax=Candidatus Danuiimicrobium aquiferis TaxID=1801832 RepID=A0A1G1KZN9_9BACT|nr:MAG: preprotein translocase [Omnitrophica bacterium RIFCSPHIGHO2_02_FULL_45_28]OGW89448.1 MAG: preprotein translocase [Omnitrophica bacterium RIFCSPHIGHO2_12_FULL_44_12]OGW98341.1 MAG: preprotein translocase [Omnitrophica bacterium RIFCSPLOWO2_12_FULL_44_17]OGX02899.1 MAG: preprotein translocase [Omnitrophica bacterium RIFCSPLOWO2_02_FULL_44_11]
MFGLGFQEVLVILLVAVLIFGAGRLPEIGKALGKAIREFKKAVDGSTETKEEKK